MDRNLMTGIWFDWMNVNNRVHGWGSKENPLRKGLDSWKSASGQDAHSWTETLEIPAEIREAIQAKKTIPQWPENKR
ncbi:MAG TPA: hypothetical protein VFC14_07855 [Burkholderiales bacterium]|jgi:hypothetical protein|nr:hypothetical protein [Burkholderiales bacterium]